MFQPIDFHMVQALWSLMCRSHCMGTRGFERLLRSISGRLSGEGHAWVGSRCPTGRAQRDKRLVSEGWPGNRSFRWTGRLVPHVECGRWAAGNHVELVFLPICGSWLNWIEAEFAALRHFALNGTDHRSHTEQNAAIAAYVA